MEIVSLKLHISDASEISSGVMGSGYGPPASGPVFCCSRNALFGVTNCIIVAGFTGTNPVTSKLGEMSMILGARKVQHL